MNFLRLQEYYESSSSLFLGKRFRLLDYIEWYAKNNNNSFSYPNDWTGFNLPSKVFHEVYSENITDANKYDYFMKSVYDFINRSIKNNFYLIGAMEGDKDTIEHEYAHALFSLDNEYKSEQLSNISGLGKKADGMIKIMSSMGYSKSATPDEIQAYMATGQLIEELKKFLGKKYLESREPFVYTLEKYSCLDG